MLQLYPGHLNLKLCLYNYYIYNYLYIGRVVIRIVFKSPPSHGGVFGLSLSQDYYKAKLGRKAMCVTLKEKIKM